MEKGSRRGGIGDEIVDVAPLAYAPREAKGLRELSVGVDAVSTDDEGLHFHRSLPCPAEDGRFPGFFHGLEAEI